MTSSIHNRFVHGSDFSTQKHTFDERTPLYSAIDLSLRTHSLQTIENRHEKNKLFFSTSTCINRCPNAFVHGTRK